MAATGRGRDEIDGVKSGVKSFVRSGVRRLLNGEKPSHHNQDGHGDGDNDSAYGSPYNSEYDTENEDQLSDASSMGRRTPEQKKKLTKKARSSMQPPLKTSDALEMAHAAMGRSASPTPKSPCNINELPIKISALGLNGPKAMRIDVSSEDENSFTITFDGRSRLADDTTHLWMVPSYDKTIIRKPEGGWIIEVWLKYPSTKDDSDGPPAGESPAEPPTEPPSKKSPQTPIEVLQNYFEGSGRSESPQTPVAVLQHFFEGSGRSESPQTPVAVLRHLFEGLGKGEDEIDGTSIDPAQYPLRLVRMNSTVSVVHMDDPLLITDSASSLWALEKHDSYQTMREPSRFKENQDETDNTKFLAVDKLTHEVIFATQEQNSFATMETKDLTVTKDPSPQVTDKTRYLAIDDDTKEPFLVRAGEYHACLITPQKRLSVTNADVYKT